MNRFQRLLLCAAAALLALPLHAAPFAYFTTPASQTLTVVDAATGQTVHTVNLPGLTSAEVSPSGRWVFLANGSSINVYNLAAKQTSDFQSSAQTLALSGEALALASSLDGLTLFVAQKDKKLARFSWNASSKQWDSGTSIDLGITPAALEVNAAASVAYVASADNAAVLDVDLSNNVISATRGINAIASSLKLSVDGTLLAVSTPSANQIAVYQVSDHALIGTASLSNPGALLVVGSKLLTALPNAIDIRDFASPATAGTSLAVNGTARELAASFTGDTLYLNFTDGASQIMASGISNDGYRPVAGHVFGPYPPRFIFASTAVSEAENVGTLQTLKVLRQGDATGTVSVDFATYDLGTATSYALAGQDYVAWSSTLSFAPDVSELLIPVTIINDALYGDTEAFGVTLSNPQGGDAYLTSTVTATVSITNDDDDPRDKRSGCTIGGGSFDPLWGGFLLLAAIVIWRKRRMTRQQNI